MDVAPPAYVGPDPSHHVLICVNVDKGRVTGFFDVMRFNDTTPIHVMFENRTINITDAVTALTCQFQDEFEELDTHVYRL